MLTRQELLTIQHALGCYPDQIRRFLDLTGDGSPEDQAALDQLIADTQSAMAKIDEMLCSV